MLSRGRPTAFTLVRQALSSRRFDRFRVLEVEHDPPGAEARRPNRDLPCHTRMRHFIVSGISP